MGGICQAFDTRDILIESLKDFMEYVDCLDLKLLLLEVINLA